MLPVYKPKQQRKNTQHYMHKISTTKWKCADDESKQDE